MRTCASRPTRIADVAGVHGVVVPQLQTGEVDPGAVADEQVVELREHRRPPVLEHDGRLRERTDPDDEGAGTPARPPPVRSP